MNTFDVILHPTDFSTDSDQAFLLACSIARDQFAELVVVHVLAPSNCPDCDSDADLLKEDRPAVSDCREQFQLQLQGSVAEGVLRQGHCPVLCLRQPTPHPMMSSLSPPTEHHRVIACGDDS